MQRKHAQLLLLTSLALLTLVVVDFVKISTAKHEPARSQTNLTDAVKQIGHSLTNRYKTILGESATISAPNLQIKTPQDKFEVNNKNMAVQGSVSDYFATISAKLNDRFLGVVKTTSGGAFTKEMILEKGSNKIVLTAVASTGAIAVASVSGILLAGAESGNVLIYILLFILALLAGYGLIRSLRHAPE